MARRVGKLAGIGDDVKEADMGQSMQAYFDKDKGRWVFPGQNSEEEVDDPGSRPPPIMPPQAQVGFLI
jgi:hypothetical protein